MLRLTNIKLALDHPKSDLETAILKKLGIQPKDLLGYVIFKRSYDARRKNDIKLIYTLHVECQAEKKIFYGENAKTIRSSLPRIQPTNLWPRHLMVWINAL